MMDDMDAPEYTPADLEKIGKDWCERIEESYKREEEWFKSAEKAEAAYLCDTTITNAEIPDFNILHSNVETIVPAIYNSTPRPEIRPGHTISDPEQRKAAKTLTDIHEAVITSLIDDNRLDKEIEAGAQDAFMAGRDVVRLKFDADVQEGKLVVDEFGEQFQMASTVTGETVIFEVVAWSDFRMGPAKRWSDVPWVAYGHDVSEEEREQLENPEYKLDDDKKDQPKDCKVWEIWCKDTRKVYFIIEETCTVLDIIEDPLELDGFFPQGEPVQPITATKNMTPVCPYVVYKALAEELDTATKRINKIMKGLKVRGVIAGDASLVDLISEAGDNDLAPVPNLESYMAVGGLEKAIAWFPADMAIAVLRELYLEREQTKQAIYEVTGISDIIRGQGAASETATAQQIKTQWGALRVKKMQRMIERQVRDLFVLTAEIVSKHFTAQTISKMTGMQLTPEIEPQFRAWGRFRIDVESDSTIRADATQNRQEMGEFLQGTAQFFQTMAPIAAQAPQSIGPMAKMYAAFARQFSLGKEAEDALDQFIQMADQASQQKQGPSPQEQAMAAEMEMKKADLQLRAKDGQRKDMQLKLDDARFEKEHGLKVGVEAAKAQLAKGRLDLDEATAEVSAAAQFDNDPQSKGTQ